LNPLSHRMEQRKRQKKYMIVSKLRLKEEKLTNFFEELDHEYETRKTDREVDKNIDTAKRLITTSRLGETLEIQERRSNKKRKTEENVRS
jgi:hypothetical protein